MFQRAHTESYRIHELKTIRKNINFVEEINLERPADDEDQIFRFTLGESGKVLNRKYCYS